MSGVETVITVVAIMAYSVARQILGEPLRVKRLIGLPAALTVIGVANLANSKGPGLTRMDLVLIVLGCAVNAAIGMCQGRLMRLESRHGYLWGQMPRSVLWWWAAKIASGVVLDGIGHVLGAGLATTSAVMLLRLGVNRLAQAAIVAPRALATGIPFAPEPDKHAADQNGHLLTEKNRLLAEIRDRTSTVLDGAHPDLPASRHAPGRPGTSPIQDACGSRTAPTATVDRSSTPQTSPPRTSLKRQIGQVLLREINNRIDDAVKEP